MYMGPVSYTHLPFALTISVYEKSAPIAQQISRKARSVTPAMGASRTGNSVSGSKKSKRAVSFGKLMNKTARREQSSEMHPSAACGELSCARGVRTIPKACLRGQAQSSVACGDSSFQKGAFWGRSRARAVRDAARRKPNEQGSARKPLLRRHSATIAN